jgi:hypothetical protein
MKLQENKEYEYTGTQVTLKRAYFAVADEWIKEMGVTLTVHVPMGQNNEPYDFGYLMAEWAIPTCDQIRKRDTDITKHFREFDRRVLLARAAGQLECALLPVAKYRDYIGNPPKLCLWMANVAKWAIRCGVYLEVRVEKDKTSERGWLVARWDVPVNYTDVELEFLPEIKKNKKVI